MPESKSTAALPDLISAAKALLLAKARFNRQWLCYWLKHLQPCDEATFSRLLAAYRGFVEQFVFRYQRRDVGVEQASGELFRQASTGEASWTWEEAAGFVKFYEGLYNQLGTALPHLFEFHGDGFSDLCDSLPLAGEEVVRRSLASHPRSHRPRREGFLDEAELNDAVNALGPQWSSFILRGENYVRSALRAACKQYWLCDLLLARDARNGWSEQEQEELSDAYHGDE
jgi:hypothetical protein